jgi:hypothetical protein
VLIDRLLTETQPTVSFLNHLGVHKYVPFSFCLGQERERLRTELAARQNALGGQRDS